MRRALNLAIGTGRNCCLHELLDQLAHILTSAKREDIEALVAQSQKRSAVYDIVTNPTNVTVVVN